MDDIISEVKEEITTRCYCVFEVDSETFSCRGAQGNFENTVVFRARITVQGHASIFAADVVNDITNWTLSSPSIPVAAVTLAIDPNCPVMLDSFNSADCVIVTEQPTSSSTNSSSSPVGIIAGTVAAALIAICIAIVAVILIVGYCRRRVNSR